MSSPLPHTIDRHRFLNALDLHQEFEERKIEKGQKIERKARAVVYFNAVESIEDVAHYFTPTEQFLFDYHRAFQLIDTAWVQDPDLLSFGRAALYSDALDHMIGRY